MVTESPFVPHLLSKWWQGPARHPYQATVRLGMLDHGELHKLGLVFARTHREERVKISRENFLRGIDDFLAD
jgi:hypothetical protein